jgi:monofunctional biosynthetic peptidoglycan transglycosylase
MKTIIPKFFYIIFNFIKNLLILYSVVFSLAATISIIWIYFQITKPIKEVKYLISNNPSETKFMQSYRNNLLRNKKSDTLIHYFVPLDSISKFLRQAVIAAEDDGFYTHPGIDIESILAAAEYNRQKNKIVHGGSTITQQLAKNLFCDHEKNFMRKFKELGYTLLLEKYLSKDRILELYLNYAQWGERIFGCEAASKEYFKKSCNKLSLYEASRLAAILAMPSKLSPNNTKSVFMQKRISVITNNLYKKHLIDDSAYTSILGLPPPKDSSLDTSEEEK